MSYRKEVDISVSDAMRYARGEMASSSIAAKYKIGRNTAIVKLREMNIPEVTAKIESSRKERKKKEEEKEKRCLMFAHKLFTKSLAV